MTRIWLVLTGLSLGCGVTQVGEDTGPEGFELIGTWVYTGGDDDFSGMLEISETEVESTFTQVNNGNEASFERLYRILSSDNEANQAVTEVESCSPTASCSWMLGDLRYYSWRFEGEDLLIYPSWDDFAVPSGGTEDEDYSKYSRL